MPGSQFTPVVSINSRAPYFYPPAQHDAEGNEVSPAVYAGLMVSVDIVLEDGSRSGSQVVEVAEDATDEQIKTAVLALYGVAA